MSVNAIHSRVMVVDRDGVVTVTGNTSEGYHRSLAQEVLAGLPRVKRVNNRQELKYLPIT